jgi:hypothetical protein
MAQVTAERGPVNTNAEGSRNMGESRGTYDLLVWGARKEMQLYKSRHYRSSVSAPLLINPVVVAAIHNLNAARIAKGLLNDDKLARNTATKAIKQFIRASKIPYKPSDVSLLQSDPTGGKGGKHYLATAILIVPEFRLENEESVIKALEGASSLLRDTP